MQNRSVPANTILPHVAYQDIDAAIGWLARTFGFIEHYRYGHPVSGAQMHLGDAWIMVKRADPASKTPAQLGYGTQSLTIFVEDVEARFAKAISAAATIVEDLHETIYGELQFAVIDLEGHHWLISQHASDISPDAWGATIAPR